MNKETEKTEKTMILASISEELGDGWIKKIPSKTEYV
jgi:hypothetical protein